MSTETETSEPPSRSRVLIAQIAAYLLAWLVVLPVEINRWRDIPFENTDIFGWPKSIYWDAPLSLPLLLLAPLAWWCRRQLFVRRRKAKSVAGTSWWTLNTSQSGGAGPRAWWLACCVGIISLAMSAYVGSSFAGLPPGYHDEYSYLFQAETFLDGQLSYPSHEAPRLFDQVHVLNEGRFASRYFHGTGLWMAPFVAWGHPYWGHWLAGAVTAFFVFWTGRELGGDGTGLTAGLITALSPGMALFSNMLLAHHPTLAGLSLFLFAFTRMRTRNRSGDALLAGVGLAFAMWCRPMTAAGVGLPFGIVFGYWLLTGNGGSPNVPLKRRGKLAVALAGPLIAGLGGIYGYNLAITGDGLLTPYQRYTDIYTPRHVYGFNNVVRGEQRLGPRVMDNYDRWAENLTPELAAENVGKRLIASTNWTLGIVPLCMVAVVFVVAVPRTDGKSWLIFLAIVSLHAAHVPYWYDGIMHWHYVFESGPLWALVFGVVTCRLVRFWRADERPWMPLWWTSLVLTSMWMSYCSFDPFWQSRISQEITNIRFGRTKHARFRQLIHQNIGRGPAVVFVNPDPADRHIDYVVNAPQLDADVLFARYLPKQFTTARLRELFPSRELFLYHAASGRLELLR